MSNLSPNLNIQVDADTQFVVFSDIHEHPRHFFKALEMHPIHEKCKLITCGDLIDKGEGYEAFLEIVNYIKDLQDAGLAYTLKGNHELKRIKKAKQRNVMDPCLTWLDKQPLIYSFVYPNNKRYTVVHAGITPKMTWENINNNLDLCYTRAIGIKGNSVPTYFDGSQWRFKEENTTNWHELYDGRFGYVISGHQPLEDGQPLFYENSCNIDTACFMTKTLTGLLVSQNSIKHFQTHGI